MDQVTKLKIQKENINAEYFFNNKYENWLLQSQHPLFDLNNQENKK